jgi:hypothetical protein
MASVNFAVEPPCLFARGRDGPVRPISDRITALAISNAIREDEGSFAGAIRAQSRAHDLVIMDKQIAAAVRHDILCEPLGEMGLHA